mmetsp:Transcript_21407/g.46877  ORF Transcript_21407/g.46877 Transcript_21407/m.46877 type:complete len:106 (-) Transcript_21407:685-1002(-)
MRMRLKMRRADLTATEGQWLFLKSKLGFAAASISSAQQPATVMAVCSPSRQANRFRPAWSTLRTRCTRLEHLASTAHSTFVRTPSMSISAGQLYSMITDGGSDEA